jgi:hypothetical protein
LQRVRHACVAVYLNRYAQKASPDNDSMLKNLVDACVKCVGTLKDAS